MNQAVGAPASPPVMVTTTAANPYASLTQISHLDYSARGGDEPAPADQTAHVPTISLREFLESARVVPDLIFMDIEGCELEVLHDLQPILRAEGRRPLVYFELHRSFYGEAGLAWLRDLFERSGYGTRRVAEHLLCTPERPATLAGIGRFTR
jgi:FkbM family methyltransferase